MPTNEKPTHLDLFSGIGGFSLGFEAEGFETIGFAETDPYASAVLKKHWPDIRNYGDVRNVPSVHCDVLTGGFPCQPFSQVRQAGKPKGTTDNRYLWPAMLQIIKVCRPTWVVGENVNGIINMALDTCIADLEAVGYTCQPVIIPACALDAAHIRQRVWILAHAASLGRSESRAIYYTSTEKGGRTKQTTRPHRRRLPELGSSNRRAVKLLNTELPMAVQYSVDRRAPNGLSPELDRIRCLGNSVVPSLVAVFARAIKESLNNEKMR